MQFRYLNKKAFISFVIFCIITIKDILVSDLELIPIRSPTNRVISWFIILPITIIGCILSLQSIYKAYLNQTGRTLNKNYLNIFLALPILIYLVYVIILP